MLRPVSRTRERDQGENAPRTLAASLVPAAWPAGTLGSLCSVRSVWTSRRAVSLHVALIVFVPACAALTWWQVSRALGGNTLSWVYTFEWPIFAAYAVFMWWKLVHEEPVHEEPVHEASGPDGAGGPGPDPGATTDAGDAIRAGHGGGRDERDEQDEELAAYNRYLADLNASGRQKRW